MKSYAAILILLLIIIQIVQVVNGQENRAEYVEVYSYQGDTYQTLRNYTSAFQNIAIKFFTIYNDSFLYYKLVHGNGTIVSKNNSVLIGFTQFNIVAPANISRLEIRTKTLRITFVSIITNLKYSYQDLKNKYEELRRQLVIVNMTLSRFYGYLGVIGIFVSVGAVSGIVYAYSRVKSDEFIEVLAGGKREFESDELEGNENEEGD